LVALLCKKVNNSSKIGDETSVPEEWMNYGVQDFQKIVKNLDKYNAGKVNWKQLLTYACLLKSPLVDEKQWQALEAEVGKPKATRV